MHQAMTLDAGVRFARLNVRIGFAIAEAEGRAVGRPSGNFSRNGVYDTGACGASIVRGSE